MDTFESVLGFLSYPIEMPLWLFLAISFPIYVAFMWAITRIVLRSREDVVCPRTGETASVVFLRGPDGFREKVLGCSLLQFEPENTCDEECRGQRA
jgi:hypothetical protein